MVVDWRRRITAEPTSPWSSWITCGISAPRTWDPKVNIPAKVISPAKPESQYPHQKSISPAKPESQYPHHKSIIPPPPKRKRACKVVLLYQRLGEAGSRRASLPRIWAIQKSIFLIQKSIAIQKSIFLSNPKVNLPWPRTWDKATSSKSQSPTQRSISHPKVNLQPKESGPSEPLDPLRNDYGT